MSKSAIDTLRGQLAQRPQEWVFWDGSARLPLFDVMCEVDAIIAERDALKARLTPPARKLREYKGIVYDPACEKWRDGPVHFSMAVDVVVARHPFTDADHAAIYALKDDPYEPVETVEDVIGKALGRAYRAGNLLVDDWEGTDTLTRTTAEQVRLAVAHEAEGAA